MGQFLRDRVDNMAHQEDLLISDAQLVERLSTGDESAFQDIYRKYWYKLYMTAKRKSLSDADAEEMVQDIFIDLWERRHSSEIGLLRNYLFSSVKYKILNYRKSQIVRLKYQSHFLYTADLNDHNTESELARQDLNQAISIGVGQLPQKTQEIFRLNRLEDKSIKEVSEILGIPQRTVEYHITQSLRALRCYLKEFLLGLLVFSDLF